MAIQRTNPIAVAVPGYGGQDLQDQVKQLHKHIQAADDARQPWIAKQERLLRQRRGIRKPKVFPWPGANNANWPLIDGVIRRWKPGITGLVSNADPVVYFFGTKPEGARVAPTAQAFYHHRFNDIPNLENTLMELTDYIGQFGVAYTRQGWLYKTDTVCRVVRVDSLFPNGVEAAVSQYNANLANARQQAIVAVDAGQAPAEALNQIPDPITPDELILQTLEAEYGLSRQDREEGVQLTQVVQQILQGALTIKLIYRTVIYDSIDWKAINPLDVIVPPRATSLDEAEFIAIVHKITTDELRRKARDGYFNIGPVDEVASKIETRSKNTYVIESEFDTPSGLGRFGINEALDAIEGLSTGQIEEPNSTTIIEVYAQIDIDNDGFLERVVLWYHPATMTILALYRYPYPFTEWPITQYTFERTNNRIYGPRGIAEMLSVFQKEVNSQHNTRLDAMQVSLMPMFQMRSSAGQLKKNIKFFPGSIIPVQQVGDISPLVNNIQPLTEFLREENFTKNLAEQYIGVFDPGLLSNNPSERRTATEVEAVVNQIQSVFGQDARLFQMSMARTHRQLWHLLIEFAPETLYFRVTGEDQPRFSKKSEIAFDYDLVPSGTPANTSKQLEMARAREAMQLFVQDQTGVIDKHALYTWYFSLLDRNQAKLIVRSPEQAAAVQLILQQAQVLNNNQPVPAF